MEDVLLKVFVGVVVWTICKAIEKITYYIIGKIQKKKNDAHSKDHRS